MAWVDKLVISAFSLFSLITSKNFKFITMKKMNIYKNKAKTRVDYLFIMFLLYSNHSLFMQPYVSLNFTTLFNNSLIQKWFKNDITIFNHRSSLFVTLSKWLSSNFEQQTNFKPFTDIMSGNCTLKSLQKSIL